MSVTRESLFLGRDSTWVRNAFMLRGKDISSDDVAIQQNRSFTTAMLKFSDSTPGGNFAINMPPQFNARCDLRYRPLTNVNPSGATLGRIYSEMIDDNSQLVHFRMGVPKFNSMFSFFTGFYSQSASYVARTGRAPDVFYRLGSVLGAVTMIVNWPLLMVSAVGSAFDFFTERQSSQYYYFKPAMPPFWSTAQTICNQICVNAGIVPRVFQTYPAENELTRYTRKFVFDDRMLGILRTLGNGLFTDRGNLNLYEIATKAERKAHNFMLLKKQQMDATNGNITKAIRNALANVNNVQKIPGGLDGLLEKWNASPGGRVKPASSTTPSTTTTTASSTSGGTPATNPTENSDNAADAIKLVDDGSGGQKPDPKDSFFDYLRSEARDGSAFVTFRVNATGPVSESFTNSTKEAEIKGTINATSADMRSKRFTFMDGNIASGGIIGSVVDGVKNAVTGVVGGALDAVGMSGVLALAGNAFVDIPEMWADSQANLPRSSYTIEMNCAYNNPISRAVNQYIPLSLLLAMSLPRAAGKQSYTTPPLVQYFDRGRAQSRMAIVDSLQIERGYASTGWDQEGRATSIRATLSLKELSSVCYVPVSEGPNIWDAFRIAGAGAGGAVAGAAAGAATTGAIGAAAGAVAGALIGASEAAGVFSPDGTFSDYMNIIAGSDLYDQIYVVEKWKKNATVALANWDTWLSLPHFSMTMGDTMPIKIIGAFMRGTARGTVGVAPIPGN